MVDKVTGHNNTNHSAAIPHTPKYIKEDNSQAFRNIGPDLAQTTDNDNIYM